MRKMERSGRQKRMTLGLITCCDCRLEAYGVKVTAPGFHTAVRPPFTLVLNQTARVNVQMKVGKISETVEVTGASPVLQTENAQVGTVMDARHHRNLPLTARNYVQLTLLSPGTVTARSLHI